MNTFTAGDKVRINYPESDWHGRICTYKHPDTNQQIDVVSHFVIDDAIPGGVGKWIQTRYLELYVKVRADEYADMSADEQVALLTEELYLVSRSYVAASTHRDRLQHDLEHYDTVMRETKEAQGWCDDGSNEVIAHLNNGFDVHFIEPYEQEFEVEYEITASVKLSGTYTIMASSQEAADEFFSDDPDSYITPETLAKEAVTYGDWDNIEVEVL
jgi:hypothetical protein